MLHIPVMAWHRDVQVERVRRTMARWRSQQDFPQMLKLVIGNKNYSSWSMRPWLALRANDIPFEEVFIPLYTDNKADKDRILSFPRCRQGAGADRWRRHGVGFAFDHRISRREIPASRSCGRKTARAGAHARSISAEMHSGFMALRNECGMNLHRPVGAVAICRTTRAPTWRGSRRSGPIATSRYGKEGPFLFGAFGGADAMFAPVVHRFRTYAIRGGGRGAALFRCDGCAAGVPAMDPRRARRNAR